MNGMKIDQDALYTVDEVASIAHRGKASVYRWIGEGLRANRRSGGKHGSYYIAGGDLYAFLRGETIED